MNSDRKNSIIAGILLLLGFAGIFVAVLANPILKDPNRLAQSADQAYRLAGGAFFQLIMAFACAGIPVFLFPILRKDNEALALGSVVFRLLEAAMFIASAVGLLVLIPLGREFVQAGSPADSYFQTMGGVILAARAWSSRVLGILAWSLGAFMYHCIFYRTKLIPRWLAAWGLAGVPLVWAASVLVLFQLVPIDSTPQVVLNLPLGLQEIPLAIWLIAKGCDPSAIASMAEPAKAGIDQIAVRSQKERKRE
jgi:uncharacterized membrane protein